MEPEAIEHEVNTTDDFWARIEDILAAQCTSHDHIDNALRSYLRLLDEHRGMICPRQALRTERDDHRETVDVCGRA